MTSQIEVLESDGSLENMFRLFRLLEPRGTVNQFSEWFVKLKAHQESVKLCPWCKGQPALRVGPNTGGDNRVKLVYSVACEGETCPVNPALNDWYDSPEKTIKEWAHDH